MSTVDNHGSDPARVWLFDNLVRPTVTRAPLVLKAPNGTPYSGFSADDEGLAVLPDGTFLVSSETEPSIRILVPTVCNGSSSGPDPRCHQ